MIIIFAIFLTTVFAQQEKYINLLPEDDKQVLLDNVARRVLKSVGSNGTNKENRELTDEQLRKHDYYVQAVIEQETAASEPRRNKRQDRSSKDNKSKENDDFKEDLEVNPFQFRDSDVDQLDIPEADNMGLAVAGVNRRSYDGIPSITDTPETNNITENTLYLQTKSVTIDVTNVETTKASTIKKSNEEENKTKYLSKSTLESETQMQDPVESTTETKNKNKIKTSSTVFENNLQYKTTSEINVLLSVTAKSSAATDNYSAVAEDRLVKENSKTILETTAFTPMLTKSNIKEEHDTKNPKIMKLSKTIRQSENDALVSYAASKALNKLKLELRKKGKFLDREVKAINKGNTHLNHYQVYEIPWPNKQPFLKSQEPIKHQPYFIPVYKYSPNVAYYNPENRHGLHEAEEYSIGLDTNLRQGNNDTHDKLQDFEKLGKEIVHSTLAPITTSTTAHESNDNCESTENESSDCEPSKETSMEARIDDSNKKKGATIAEILSVTDERDLLINLEKLQAMGLPLMRSKAESKGNIYMNVLKDLILEDSKVLKQYDWLSTSVQIQSALTKILKLIKRMRQSKQLYPTDLQVLKYMLFLHNFSLEIKKDNKIGYELRKSVKLLPRNKKKRKNRLLKVKGLIKNLGKNDVLSNFYVFLIDVQDALFDLHEAIRHIADVTKFNRQNWYGNLKQPYLSTDEKQLRELLLHISMSRLVDLVEHSCKHSLDRDFIQFVKTNMNDAVRIIEEMKFINDIVQEIKINKR